MRALRAGKSGTPAAQPLGSNSSSLGTGSYGAPTMGLNADANGLLNAIINRLPPGSLSGEHVQMLSVGPTFAQERDWVFPNCVGELHPCGTWISIGDLHDGCCMREN